MCEVSTWLRVNVVRHPGGEASRSKALCGEASRWQGVMWRGVKMRHTRSAWWRGTQWGQCAAR
eukprot:353485-Chlamydomonas_euryale.AAC.1